MTSIPAEFYALVNAFLFAVHNIFTKKALRYSNPATGVISSLMINIVFLWTMSFLFVPMANVTLASLMIFVGVGFFQPGLTRLLTYKGIDSLGVAITDPIRASTPLFSAAMAIVFLGEEITLPIIVATLMIISRHHAVIMAPRGDETCRLGGFSLVSDRCLGAGRRFPGRAQVRHGRGAASVSRRRGDRDFIAVRVDLVMWYVERSRRDLENEPPMLLVVSRRGNHRQLRHDLDLSCIGSRQSLGCYSLEQHRPVLFVDSHRAVFARRRTGDAADHHQRLHDRQWGRVDQLVEVGIRKNFSRRERKGHKING